MTLENFQPIFKFFGNTFQITFPNMYSVVIKFGPGTNSTNKQIDDIDVVNQLILSKKARVHIGPDVEVEVYHPNKQNISKLFNKNQLNSCQFVNTIEFVNLLYIVSSLK